MTTRVRCVSLRLDAPYELSLRCLDAKGEVLMMKPKGFYERSVAIS